MPGCSTRHAVVTGASTGIGHATVLELSRRGFHVFGTVRRHEDAAAIRHSAPGEVTPLIMDVTEPDQIRAAAKSVERHVGRSGLDVLVNNAGVGVAYPLELIPLETLREQFAVNVEAPVAVTQALLPLIRQAPGRVIMIGSIGDRITMPFAGPLTSAKHAVKALADAFRLELAAWGIRVVLVEPATIRTDAVGKLERDAAATLDSLSPEGRALYAEAFTAMTNKAVRAECGGSPPSVVAKTVARAAQTRRPKTRYLVGKHSRLLAVAATLPPGILDRLRRKVFDLPERAATTESRS